MQTGSPAFDPATEDGVEDLIAVMAAEERST